MSWDRSTVLWRLMNFPWQLPEQLLKRTETTQQTVRLHVLAGFLDAFDHSVAQLPSKCTHQFPAQVARFTIRVPRLRSAGKATSIALGN